jgi:hypothetical protein
LCAFLFFFFFGATFSAGASAAFGSAAAVAEAPEGSVAGEEGVASASTCGVGAEGAGSGTGAVVAIRARAGVAANSMAPRSRVSFDIFFLREDKEQGTLLWVTRIGMLNYGQTMLLWEGFYGFRESQAVNKKSQARRPGFLNS